MSRILDGLAVVAFFALFSAGIGAVAMDPAVNAPFRVELHIRYSHFDPSTLSVPAGRPVTFVLHNDDPIEHEWIVGDSALHQRHRAGTEQHHASRPTEVSIPANSTIETTITFAEPVAWQYICHLPGHEAYGMVGLLSVR